MAKRRRRRRRVRVTPLGYAVLGILVLILAVGIYSIAWKSAQEKNGAEAHALETDAPVDTAVSSESTPTLPPLASDTPIPVMTTTPAPTPITPTEPPEPEETTGLSNGVKNPTSKQEKNAVDGKLTSSGVVLRRGPDKGYDIIAKYTSGTNLQVFAKEGDYYFVRVVADKKIGYMATKFIEKFGLLSGEEATPTPVAVEGAVSGVVNAKTVAIRTMPSKDGNTPTGQCVKGDRVWIFFKSGEFYYCQLAATGEKGYLYAEFILAQSAVPEGTPVPG